MARFPVFLSRSTYRDSTGTLISLAERRLVRQSPDDTILAVVDAPRGSYVRSRPDPNGPDQLVVPLRSSILGLVFGGRVTIPAKYLIGDAHRGVHGLRLATRRPEALKT